MALVVAAEPPEMPAAIGPVSELDAMRVPYGNGKVGTAGRVQGVAQIVAPQLKLAPAAAVFCTPTQLASFKKIGSAAKPRQAAAWFLDLPNLVAALGVISHDGHYEVCLHMRVHPELVGDAHKALDDSDATRLRRIPDPILVAIKEKLSTYEDVPSALKKAFKAVDSKGADANGRVDFADESVFKRVSKSSSMPSMEQALPSAKVLKRQREQDSADVELLKKHVTIEKLSAGRLVISIHGVSDMELCRRQGLVVANVAEGV
jgi:hypothetical protein